MATQYYGTQSQRIGKIKGEILKHAVPREVLGITGNQHRMPKNPSDTIVFRRWLPYGGSTSGTGTTYAENINKWSVTASAHQVNEGVTPAADTLSAQDITVTLNEYACLYMYTNKTADLYEDNIPDEMKKQTGQRMGLVREMIRYGALKGCVNKYYAGGTSRSTVDETISLNMLRKVTKGLMGNRADPITQILSGSANYATKPIEGGFLVFCHTDMEHDIRELPGFTPCAEYGQRKPIHELELGAADRYRFIISPELSSIADSGAAIGSTGLVSTTGTSIDVYPLIVVADDAWGDVALRGMDSFNVTHVPVGQKDKNDPLGQRGYIGACFWSAAFVQNDGWMAVIEAGATNI